MTCKHRWVESEFGRRWRTPNHYMYQCTRCNGLIFTFLKAKT